MACAVLPSAAAVTLEPLLAWANGKRTVNTKIHDENVIVVLANSDNGCCSKAGMED